DTDVPALMVAPGRGGYRSAPASPVPPDCMETWTLDVWAVVPREADDYLDQLDALVDLIRTTAEAWPGASYLGATGFIGDRVADTPVYRSVATIRWTGEWMATPAAYRGMGAA